MRSKKNRYITIGLPLDSPVLRQLEEEAEVTGTRLATLIPLKLGQLYILSQEASRLTLFKPVQKEPPSETINGADANALAFLENEE